MGRAQTGSSGISGLKFDCFQLNFFNPALVVEVRGVADLNLIWNPYQFQDPRWILFLFLRLCRGMETINTVNFEDLFDFSPELVDQVASSGATGGGSGGDSKSGE